MSELIQINEMKGQVSALRYVREVARNGVVTLRFSQVTFLLSTGGDVIQGSMILWNDAANEIHQLHLGSIYRFKAVLEEKESEISLHFLPNVTSFQKISEGIKNLITNQEADVKC